MTPNEKFTAMRPEVEIAIKRMLFESYKEANMQKIADLDGKASAQVSQDIARSMLQLLQNPLLIQNAAQAGIYNIHNLSPTDRSLNSVVYACQTLTNQFPWVVPLGKDMQRFSLLMDASTYILNSHTLYYPRVYSLEKLWSAYLAENIAHETAHFTKAQELSWEACGCLELGINQEGLLGCRAGLLVYPQTYLSPDEYRSQYRDIVQAVGADLSDRDIEKLEQLTPHPFV